MSQAGPPLISTVMNRAGPWCAIQDALASFTVPKYEFSVGGVRVACMDNSRIVLAVLNLGRDGFETYELSKPCVLDIDTETMRKTLKNCQDDDRLSMVSHTAQKIVVAQHSSDQTRTFTLPLYDIDAEIIDDVDPMHYRHACHCSIDVGLFKKTMDDICRFGPEVTVVLGPDRIEFTSSGGDAGDCHAILMGSDQCIIEGDDIVTLKLASDLLAKYGTKASLSPMVRLTLCADMPIIVTYDIVSTIGKKKAPVAKPRAPKRRKADELLAMADKTGDTDPDPDTAPTFAAPWGCLRFYVAPKIED
jgi:proliferating cell nuclear antigen PCNA